MLKRSVSTIRNKGIAAFAKSAGYKLKRVASGGPSSRQYLRPVAGVFHPFFELAFRFRYSTSVDVMAEDWDTLVLLDACRYDDFAEINTLAGDLSYRFSAGADSPTFLKENFADRVLHETVYVTANPHVSKLDNEVFHATIDDPLSDWNDTYQCVMPDTVTNAALEAHHQYPNKRLIIHYMQPHDPPLGPTGDRLREKHDIAGPDDDADGGMRVMDGVANGKIDPTEARTAYRETLDIVLDEVEKLQAELNGKTVISSDHGELFGERYPILGELYEHYDHPRTRALCKVPWFVLEHDTRRSVVSDPPHTTESTDGPAVESQLKALGYSE